MWDEIKKIISPVAPVLAAALSATGPAGMAIAAGASILLKKHFCDNPDASDSALLQALESNIGEAIIRLKQLNNEFSLQMRQLDIEETYINQQDRVNARAREIALHDVVPAVLAYGLTIGFFLLLFMLVFYQVPMSSKDILQVMLGALSTAWISIITYYFGSSSSSRRKDYTIEHLK